MRIEYSDGRPVRPVDDDIEAMQVLCAEWPDGIFGEWEPAVEGTARLLFWRNIEDAGPAGLGDDGTNAIAEVIADVKRDCPHGFPGLR